VFSQLAKQQAAAAQENALIRHLLVIAKTHFVHFDTKKSKKKKNKQTNKQASKNKKKIKKILFLG
jgi:hypothetical protein